MPKGKGTRKYEWRDRGGKVVARWTETYAGTPRDVRRGLGFAREPSSGYVFKNPPRQGTTDRYGKLIGVDPMQFVEYMDAGPDGETSQEMKKAQKEKQKLHQKYQTKRKKSLLNKQPTRSKGGGRSSGGGGGKFSIINRALSGRSPWHHLKRLLE